MYWAARVTEELEQLKSRYISMYTDEFGLICYVRVTDRTCKQFDTAPSCTYIYLDRSLPTYGCACEDVRNMHGHMDGANTDGLTGVTPETYGWSTGKPSGFRTAVKRKLFHGMYRIYNWVAL